ncbi:MAG TPA: carboxypeptidase-like regulatory domain-containing protein [Solirubrobacteraceae bacterium]
MLIETIISAALLIVVVVGVMAGFDTAGRITGYEQRRSEANALAQQDQNRLHALTIFQLSGLSQTNTVTEGNTQFTIQSTGQFQSQATGSASCSATGSADYILASSTVTWGSGTGGPARQVVASSLVTPQPGGGLIVQVVSSQGTGVQNMSVTATGPQTVSSTTGANGCAIFAGLLGGTYNVTVSQPGYVDKDGNTTPPVNQQAQTVIEGSSAVKVLQFDQAGSINVTFTTIPYGGSQPVTTSGDQVTIFNNNMTYPGFRWAGVIASYQPSVTATGMFPFSSAYTVYAGSCSANDPRSFGVRPPGVIVPPGAGANVQFQLPPLYLTVYSGTSSVPGPPLTNAHVVVTDQGCGGNPPTAGGAPLIKRVFSTNASGQIPNPGLPFGNYTVCADTNAGAASVFALQSNVTNSSLTGTSVALYLGSVSRGVCT